MREQIHKPQQESGTIQSKASKQAPIAQILQTYKNKNIQLQTINEEELLQGKFETTQREAIDEEELLQGKFDVAQRQEIDDDELLQGKFETAQREAIDEEELLQGKFDVIQMREYYAYGSATTTPHIHCYSGIDCHLKLAGGKRIDLVQGGFRVEQAVINDAFDSIRAQYPIETNERRIQILQIMSDLLRDAPIRRRGGIAQRKSIDEEELLQGKFDVAQRQEIDDDELLQGKFETAQREAMGEEELLQGKFDVAQRQEIDDDKLLQGKFETAQRQENSQFSTLNSQLPNNTGLPDNLKSGIENASGYSMDDVKVHYNSSKPAQLQAHAYTQGSEIHVAPGQEKHLPHEAWHVVQQKQGRVQPTTQLQGVNINDNEGLEKEADVMGGKANKLDQISSNKTSFQNKLINNNIPVQAVWENYHNGVLKWDKQYLGLRWYFVPIDKTMFFLVEKEEFQTESIKELSGFQNRRIRDEWVKSKLFVEMSEEEDDYSIVEKELVGEYLWKNIPSTFKSQNVNKDTREAKGDDSTYIVGERGLVRYKAEEKKTIIHEGRHICYIVGTGKDPFLDARTKAFQFRDEAVEFIEFINIVDGIATVKIGSGKLEMKIYLTPQKNSRVVDFDYIIDKGIGKIKRVHIGHPVK